MNYKDERAKAINWLAELGNPYQINLYDPDGMLGLDLGSTARRRPSSSTVRASYAIATWGTSTRGVGQHPQTHL